MMKHEALGDPGAGGDLSSGRLSVSFPEQVEVCGCDGGTGALAAGGSAVNPRGRGPREGAEAARRAALGALR
jgi:hypothetical protein